jgi:hypothetical protein
LRIFVPKTEKPLLLSMNAPERTAAEVFPRYVGGQVLADSATLKWLGLFARRYRFPRVVDGFLVPATAEPLITCHFSFRIRRFLSGLHGDGRLVLER